MYINLENNLAQENKFRFLENTDREMIFQFHQCIYVVQLL